MKNKQVAVHARKIGKNIAERSFDSTCRDNTNRREGRAVSPITSSTSTVAFRSTATKYKLRDNVWFDYYNNYKVRDGYMFLCKEKHSPVGRCSFCEKLLPPRQCKKRRGGKRPSKICPAVLRDRMESFLIDCMTYQQKRRERLSQRACPPPSAAASQPACL